MNTNEAARAMIDGDTGILNGIEYYWTGSLFKQINPMRRTALDACLPLSDDWQIRKKPFEYKVRIKIKGNIGPQSAPSLEESLFGYGDISWARDHVPDLKGYDTYEITVKRVDSR